MPTPTRRDRILDLTLLGIILLGVLAYVHGTWQLREVARFSYEHPGPRGTKQVKVADRARYEANTGIVIVLLGAVGSAVHATRVARRNRVA